MPVEHAGRRAVGDRAATRLQHHDAVDVVQPLRHPVLDHQAGRAGLGDHPPHALAQQRRAVRVEHRRGLVEQQQDPGASPARRRGPAAAARHRTTGTSGGCGRTGKPTRRRASSTRAQISSRGTARFSSPKATSSPQRASTVCASGSCNSSPARATPRRRAAAAGSPSSSSSPSDSPPFSCSRTPSARVRCGSPSRPAAADSTVDLPAPLGPSSSTRSPGATARSSPRTAQARRPACRQPHPWACRPTGRVRSVLTTLRRASRCGRTPGARAHRCSPAPG